MDTHNQPMDPRTRPSADSGTGPPPIPPAQPAPGDPMETYHNIADTVGFVPNLRMKDNLWQTIAGVAGALVGAIVGAIAMAGFGENWIIGAVVGGLLGFIVFVVLVGLVLMVLGWVRAFRK